MSYRRTKWLAILLFAGLFAAFAVAQETSVTGGLSGVVFDSTGAVVPGASVTAAGARDTRTVVTDNAGRYSISTLAPGTYKLTVDKSGFKKYEGTGIEIVINRKSTLDVTLQPGATSETVEVSANAVQVDTSSTAIEANLPNTFYSQVPVQRNVAGLFYVSPGVVSGGGSGASNPSIGGASGLENEYVADGVNITDSAFGGLGSFSRVFGSLGSGINLAFVKEVEVKTGGFEPQYGKATGGIVQIVTKSGADAFHGNISAYFTPSQFEAERLQADSFRFNKIGEVVHQSAYEGSAELGGYIPGLRKHLFFFASVDPTLSSNLTRFAVGSPFFSNNDTPLRFATYNYAGKLTWKINDSHQIEGSLFGDPTRTNFGPFRDLTTNSATSFSALHYGSRELVVRYNGSLTPSWLVNASWTYNHNYVHEGNFANVFQISDRTQTAGLPGQRGVFNAQGIGVFENSRTDDYGFSVDTSKLFRALGQHQVTLGYEYERPNYLDFLDRTGGRFPIPATNAAGLPTTSFGVPAGDVGQLTDAAFQLRLAPGSCTRCPFMNVPGFSTPKRVYLRQNRGTFSSPLIPTSGRYHVGYVSDVYSPWKYVTFDLGVRWEQYRMVGTTLNYTFVDNWSPRLGVNIDPFGDRKTKIYFNYGRYDYVLPLDVAIRSLSNELDTIGERFAPLADASNNVILSQFGTVTPVPDAAHLLNGAPGGFPTVNISDSSGGALEAIAPGTRQEYEDEYVFGIERELPWAGLVASARYTDRQLGRIIEDTGGISPEAANAGVVQNFAITNVNSATDLFANPIEHLYTSGAAVPAACGANPFILDPVTDAFGNTVPPGAVCIEQFAKNGAIPGSFGPDGIPDGFVNPYRRYQALELELNKSFSHNFITRINYRYSKLWGNFEGAFRNDNGQTDPGISSLFDFTSGQFNLLGDQFKRGYLNTDRRNVANLYFAYTFPADQLGGRLKGLTLGTGVRGESGTPISALTSHPVYLNAGEVPLGGRGIEGRTPATVELDLHADYPFRTSEKTTLHVSWDMFNVTNTKHLTLADQNETLDFGTTNVDFLHPAATFFRTFQRPFYARASVQFVF